MMIYVNGKMQKYQVQGDTRDFDTVGQALNAMKPGDTLMKCVQVYDYDVEWPHHVWKYEPVDLNRFPNFLRENPCMRP
jgi:hypothetical protein